MPSSPLTPDFTGTAERDTANFFARIKAEREAVRSQIPAAKSAMTRIALACKGGESGQTLKLRSLLFSLWNGQPTSLIEIISLDRCLREDLLSVLRVFGSEEFFYEEVKLSFARVGLLDWFLAKGKKR